MLTEPQRHDFEQRLRAAFALATADLADELLRLLGTPPDPANVPAEFWAALAPELLSELSPLISEIAIKSALGLGESAGVISATNWSLINERAARWASRHAGEMIKNANANSIARLQELVDKYYADPTQDLKALGADIGKLFGPKRGDLIAISETTRAAAEGEGVLMAEIRRLNPNAIMDEFWTTSNDELVCLKICRPLNGVRGDGKGNFVNPADGQTYRFGAHPGCRCARRLALALPQVANA